MKRGALAARHGATVATRRNRGAPILGLLVAGWALDGGEWRRGNACRCDDAFPAVDGGVPLELTLNVLAHGNGPFE